MRAFNDPQFGPMRVLSPLERNVRRIQDWAEAKGLDIHVLSCYCCGKHLTNLNHARLMATGEGVLGPECSKNGHNLACRMRRQLVEVPAA